MEEKQGECFAEYGMIAARYFRSQLPLFVTVTIITTIAAALLIPKLGLNGAALAVILSNFAQLVGSMYIVGLALRMLRGGRQ
ncbi:MAG: hypothetical protein PWQ70_3220 [Clostridiales bacterium]|nr:hypothetical protein [Clostridiales bacterium]